MILRKKMLCTTSITTTTNNMLSRSEEIIIHTIEKKDYTRHFTKVEEISLAEA